MKLAKSKVSKRVWSSFHLPDERNWFGNLMAWKMIPVALLFPWERQVSLPCWRGYSSKVRRHHSLEKGPHLGLPCKHIRIVFRWISSRGFWWMGLFLRKKKCYRYSDNFLVTTFSVPVISIFSDVQIRIQRYVFLLPCLTCTLAPCWAHWFVFPEGYVPLTTAGGPKEAFFPWISKNSDMLLPT